MLSDKYLVELEQKARRYAGAWTGTAGSLAAGVIHLLKERREMLQGQEDDEPQCVAAMDREQMEAIWAGVKARQEDMHAQITGSKTYAPPAAGCESPAERVLREALAAVQDRRRKYGPPAEHFARTVGMINALFAHKLREPLTPREWGQIMVLDKLARDQCQQQHDNQVDAIGYTACTVEIDTLPK